jgi:hypothetical protein
MLYQEAGGQDGSEPTPPKCRQSIAYGSVRVGECETDGFERADSSSAFGFNDASDVGVELDSLYVGWIASWPPHAMPKI